MEHADVVIVGSGLVGASLAIALAGSGRRVVQIEANAEAKLSARWDERHFVLAEASRQALDRIGVWSEIQVKAPITRILANRAGEFGRLEFRAEDYHVPALGYTVPASQLHAALRAGLASATAHGLTRWQPAKVLAFDCSEQDVCVVVQREGEVVQLRADLLVAADGMNSALRAMAGIEVTTHDYQQTAIVAALRPETPHPGLAYERLTRTGPLAVLPVDDSRSGLIYTVPSAEAEAVLALSDAEFLARLRGDLRDRLGRWLGVGLRQPWPLKLVLAERLISQRLVLIGNAAQSIHPLGAQGFNLGLRDAMALAELLTETDSDAGTGACLQTYAERRRKDRNETVAMSHGLVQTSAPESTGHHVSRFLAMTALAHVPLLKQRLALGAMGFR